jgi:L-ascorbate metabolism protein UlaG (beta-lactamase superfamily)
LPGNRLAPAWTIRSEALAAFLPAGLVLFRFPEISSAISSMRWIHSLHSLFVCLLLAGCAGPVETTPARPRYVRVDWLGHESFVITSSIGKKIVTNPYGPGATGRQFPHGLRPDVLLVSTERSDANFVDAFDNSPTTFRGAMGIGVNNAAGLGIRGIPTYKNAAGEGAGDLNLVFVWVLEGMRFCFLGNIEHPLTSAQIRQIGPVDVLFMPVGLPSGLTDAARRAIVSQLPPRLIILMGRSEAFSSFASQFPKVYRPSKPSILLSKEILPIEQLVVVL